MLKWLYFLCPLGGLAAGLIGFGCVGTVQAACAWGGVGLLAPPALILVASLLEVG